ncbi:MAG: chromosome segregation protein SMC [Oscillospiraceae bacterium]|nr:chromosome segregation protein SMC [Oscillospiraceae bacterium]
MEIVNVKEVRVLVLKSVIMQGFKSFPDKIKLDFNDGITAVVGPNGSGKSNILDAIRWVLGEQSSKSLRGDKMEDVIFKGTDTRNPHGFAQVSLEFDNSKGHFVIDSDEFSVTRKYYRSGESEYFINGKNVRLKDMTELLMDTGLGKDGYSVIGQGKICEIIGAKPQKRREIFDEAAGIVKFRFRRDETRKRLEAAEANLVRSQEKLDELVRRIGPLEEQSKKAKEFNELSARRKTLEISIWVMQIDKYIADIKKQEDKILLCKGDYDRVENEVSAIETKINESNDRRQRANVLIDELRKERDRAEEEISARKETIAVMNNNIERNNEEIERIKTEIENLELSKDRTQENTAKLELEIVEINQKAEAAEAQINQAESTLAGYKTRDEQLDQSITELNSGLNNLVLEKSRRTAAVNAALESVGQMKEQLEETGRIKEEKTKQCGTARQQQSEIEKTLQMLEEKTIGLENSIKGYTLKLDAGKSKLEEKTQEYNRLAAQIREKRQKAQILQGLENNLEGFFASVKTVINAGKSRILRGIAGTVAQLINTDVKYATAIETALGSAMQNIVTNDDEAAKDIISYLKEKNAGRVTLLPMNTIKPRYLEQKGLENTDGFIDIAAKLVKYDANIENIVYNLLGNTAVAEDLNAAAEIAKKYGYRFRIVTLDGQIVNAGGSMTGGSHNKNIGILSRRGEIEKLNAEAEKAEQKSSGVKQDLSVLSAKTAKIEAEITAIDGERRSAAEDLIKFGSELKSLSNIIEQNEKDLEYTNEQSLRLTDRLSQTDTALSEHRERIAEIETQIDEKNIQLGEKTDSRDEFAAYREEIAAKLQKLDIEIAEYKKDVQNCKNSIAALTTGKEDSENKVVRLQERIKSLEQKNIETAQEKTELSGNVSGGSSKIGEIDKRIAESISERDGQERRSGELRNAEQELFAQKEGLTGELTRLQGQKEQINKELNNLDQRMWEEYQITKNEAVMTSQKLEDPHKSERELKSIKSRIKSMGEINPGAIDEYQEVNTEYEFLKQQIIDVETSKSEIIKIIKELTAEMKVMFNESFAKIKKEFSKLFVELFGGGKAELILQEPDDVLESGIEIQARPPGEKVDTLSLLSGGQQALIAIALYFAILHIRPSPFCILDEIDAALDDVNVGKYAEFLRKMSAGTQYITITHRHGTMEEADILYGVTMQEKGVSKLLKLHISDAMNLSEL